MVEQAIDAVNSRGCWRSLMLTAEDIQRGSFLCNRRKKVNFCMKFYNAIDYQLTNIDQTTINFNKMQNKIYSVYIENRNITVSNVFVVLN